MKDKKDMLRALIDNYFDTKNMIHKVFGYKSDWVEIPMEDSREYYWFIIGEGPGTCVYSDVPFTKESLESGNQLYSGPIYTQRFLEEWVYRAENFTMVCVDTQTDGNKFLMIFDNEKECKDEELIEHYGECW